MVNVKEMAGYVSDITNFSKKDVTFVIETFLDQIMEKISQGEEVKLNNLGTFRKVRKEEHTGRNPKTGESVLVEAKNTVKFKLSNNFKKYVNM